MIRGGYRSDHWSGLTSGSAILKVTNKMQFYKLIYFSFSALHVSGDVFSHLQEQLTIFTVYGNIHQCRCRLVSWMSWNWSMWFVSRVFTRFTNHIVHFKLIQDTSRKHPGWILPGTVSTVKCSWWWAKTSPETCRADKEK